MDTKGKVFPLIIIPVLAMVLVVLGVLSVETNPMGWFLILAGSVFIVGIVIAYFILQRRFWESALSGATTQEEQGNRSFLLITISLAAATFLPPIEYLVFPNAVQDTPWLAPGGLVLVALGSILFVWARRTLRKNYAGHLVVKTDQVLVQSGPYAILRHPAYTGYLLMTLGVSLGYASLVGLATIIFLVLPSLMVRIRTEEKMLTGHFGEAYRQYAQRVKRLVPLIW